MGGVDEDALKGERIVRLQIRVNRVLFRNRPSKEKISSRGSDAIRY